MRGILLARLLVRRQPLVSCVHYCCNCIFLVTLLVSTTSASGSDSTLTDGLTNTWTTTAISSQKQQLRLFPARRGTTFGIIDTATATAIELIRFRGGGSGVEEEGGGGEAGKSAVSSSSSSSDHHDGFIILHEEVLYDNWRRLLRRRVQYPPSPFSPSSSQSSSRLLQVDFELVAQKGTDQAVLVFCWNTQTKTCTLVREYMPSLHRLTYGLAAGMVEDDKHQSSSLVAAQHELEEECRMKSVDDDDAGDDRRRRTRWLLLTSGGPVTMDKYSTTRIHVYLVLDAVPIDEEEEVGDDGDGGAKKAVSLRPRDETEQGMQVVHGVTVQELRRLIAESELTIVGSWASLLALEKLRELGEIAF